MEYSINDSSVKVNVPKGKERDALIAIAQSSYTLAYGAAVNSGSTSLTMGDYQVMQNLIGKELSDFSSLEENATGITLDYVDGRECKTYAKVTAPGQIEFEHTSLLINRRGQFCLKEILHLSKLLFNKDYTLPELPDEPHWLAFAALLTQDFSSLPIGDAVDFFKGAEYIPYEVTDARRAGIKAIWCPHKKGWMIEGQRDLVQ